MCERAKDEPLLRFWFRQFKEEPLRVLICAAIFALCYLYHDGQKRQDEYRTDAKAANEALVHQLQASTQVMYEMNVSLRRSTRAWGIWSVNMRTCEITSRWLSIKLTWQKIIT